MLFYLRLWALLLLPLVMITPLVSAQTLAAVDSAPALTDIRIDGAQRIDPLTVRSYLGVKPGDNLTPQALDRALKSLFNTGLFADVKLRQDQGVLFITVQENPIINRIAFEGARKIEAETLRNEIQLKPRNVLTRSKVQADVSRIQEIYRRSGRFGAKITPKQIPLEQNRVDLVFEIEEGAKNGIANIHFIGNKNFSDGTLRGEVATQETSWYRFFGGNDSYDPDRLNADKELLRRFYLKNGYADFRIVSAVAELSPDQDNFYITFTVEEGERYRYGDIAFESKLKGLSVAQLSPLVDFSRGDWYNAQEIDKTAEAMAAAIGGLGYAFVDADPMVVTNAKTKTADIKFIVQEGQRVFVESIDIIGNVRTEDRVIRREFRVAEGDAFNAAKLRRTKQRLNNLGFFETVDLSTQPGSAPDKVKIETKVAEKSTGDLSFGAGFSTSEQLLGDIRIRERNLLGRGQDLKLSGTLSTRRTEFDLGFTEPYFLDRNLAAGFDLFHITRENQRQSSYDDKRSGGALRTKFNYNESLSQELRYNYRQVEVRNVANDASLFIKRQEGKNITSSIAQTLAYDKLDNKNDPSNGYFIRFSTDIAGLSGDSRYLRPELSAGYYYPLYENWVLGLTGDAGYIARLGQDIRITERFFIGGNSFRGFKTAGIGPRDTSTSDALGGNIYATGSAELKFPLGLPDELGIAGAVFSDVGTLTQTDDKGPTVKDSGSLRASVGFGISWRSPFGPIRVDIAHAVAKEPEDETEGFRFNFGTRF
jgi:outer membrane protein insertion porin family